MTRTAYQNTLADLRQRLIDLGALVGRRLEQGIAALVRHDEATGTLVQEGDDDVDRAFATIERTCIDVLTLQQPVAGDVRFVTAAFRIVADLERIGDLAVNLADYATDSEALSMIAPPASSRSAASAPRCWPTRCARSPTATCSWPMR
jgi:phosphate transport system protein